MNAPKALTFRDAGPRLFEAGFQPIPVNGKRPVVKDWQAMTLHEDQIGFWASGDKGALNVGIRTDDLGPESSLVRLNTAWMLRAGFDVRVLTTTRSHTLQAMDRTLMAGLTEDLVVERQASPEAVLSEVYPRAGRHIAVLLGRHVLPEIFLPWALPATEDDCRMVRQWQPHVIYSRAPKHVSNVVGWRMKHQTGLPWVAHFSEPWITAGLPYRRLQRLLGLPLERRILRDADALVFVTRQAMESMLAPHPAAWRERARSIPHGYEAAPADAGS